MKSLISELKGIYQGRAVAVLGGGPSLPADLKRLPAGTILISVNGHSLRLRGADYIVFCDNPYRDSILAKTFGITVETFSGPKISIIEQHSDYIFDVKFWNGGFSSTVATWLACYMGADLVLLCGMDCYQGEVKYFFDYEGIKIEHPCWDYPLENNLKAWAPALGQCPGSEAIKAVSGPLVEIFGRYDGK